MAKKIEKIGDKNPEVPQRDKNKPKLGRPFKKEKGGKWKVIFIIFISIAWVFAMLVIGHFLYKSCSCHKTTKPYTVHVQQPATEKWIVKVNNSDKDIKVDVGDDIKINVYPKANYADCLNAIPNNETVMFYARVSPYLSTVETPIWSSELSKAEDGQSYETQFKMYWNYDITLSIEGSTDWEESYYTKDSEGKVEYILEKTSVHSTGENAQITKIHATDLTKTTIKKSDFNETLYIGSKVKELPYGFMSNCTSFNNEIVFSDDSQLEKIYDQFMLNCTSFNQLIEFPDSLTSISGDFMANCKAFNQPIDFNNVSDVSEVTSFLFSADSFNNKVNFGTILKTIPKCFLLKCKSFNQDIEIPSQITYIHNGFLGLCNSMCSTIKVECELSAFQHLSGSESTLCVETTDCESYKTGMLAAGTNGDKFKKILPNQLEGGLGVKMYRHWREK